MPPRPPREHDRRDPSEPGEPVPAVPHEAFLGRLASSIQVGLAVVLAVVAVWAFVVGATVTSSVPVDLIGLRVNGAHACLLAVTAVLGAASCRHRRWLRRWAVIQSIAYFIVFAFGSGLTVDTPDRYGFGLDTEDHVLHAVVALLGFVVAMLSSARIIEPRPSPPAFPVHDVERGADSSTDSSAGAEGAAGPDDREMEQQR